MKAMLLAAGKGKRMLPLTEHCPKPLLEAGGKPLIVHHLDKLAQAGIRDVVINHAWLGQQIEDCLGDGRQYNVRIVYSAEGEALETAGGIIRALPLLGSEPFLVISSDIWTDYSFEGLRGFDLESDLAHLVMVNNAPHHPGGDFVLRDGRLLRAGEGEQDTCTYAGIGVFSPSMFAGMVPEFLPLRPLLEAGIEDGSISAEKHDGQWFDIGSPERLAELDQRLR